METADTSDVQANKVHNADKIRLFVTTIFFPLRVLLICSLLSPIIFFAFFLSHYGSNWLTSSHSFLKQPDMASKTGRIAKQLASNLGATKSPGSDIFSKVSNGVSSMVGRSKDLFTASAMGLASVQPAPFQATHVSMPNTRITWSEAMSAAENMVLTKGGSVINPKELLGRDLTLLTENISKLLGSGHPVLSSISNYYFSAKGKHVRPVLVLLISQATSLAPKSFAPNSLKDQDMDSAISPSANIQFDPTITTGSQQYLQPNTSKSTPNSSATSLPILPAQRRLAEITEMIHTASLLHDDVIDVSLTRRSMNSANAEFGNKMAILAGDFLLARASVALARLRNVEVVELLSSVISNLVEGEFMQLRNTPSQLAAQENAQKARFDYYLEKTYLKTASLIAKSCRAAAVLGGSTSEVVESVYSYGRNLGVAFQVS
jgi:hexaprenyl-diphosphate synthase